MNAEVLYKIGLALEGGCDEEQMRLTWGNATIDWVNKAEKCPEYEKFTAELNKENLARVDENLFQFQEWVGYIAYERGMLSTSRSVFAETKCDDYLKFYTEFGRSLM